MVAAEAGARAKPEQAAVAAPHVMSSMRVCPSVTRSNRTSSMGFAAELAAADDAAEAALAAEPEAGFCSASLDGY